MFSDYVKTPNFVLLNIIILYIGGVFMLFTVPSSNKVGLHGKLIWKENEGIYRTLNIIKLYETYR